MKVLIFPNDPLLSYFKKGELKEKYFNPNNIFDEIHFVTFTDNECKIDEIKITLGKAKGIIHTFPPLTIFDFFFPIYRINKIYSKISNYKFDVVRAFNPIVHGYIAGNISKKLSLPFIISIHTNYDLDIRYQYKKNKDIRFFKYLLTKYTTEKQTLKMATHIIAKYNFISKFVLNNGVEKNKVSTIYNRVHLNIFRPKAKQITNKLKVICVGNLIEGKGQRTLLKAMKKINKAISLTLVGDGEDYNLLKKMVTDLNLNERVKFTRSVPNYKLASLYQEHDIFAQPNKYGGFPIPALEATACGLALVMPRPIHENSPEFTGEYAEVVENTPEGFAKGINKIAADILLRQEMIAKGLNIISKYNGDVMELKESKLYKNTIRNYKVSL